VSGVNIIYNPQDNKDKMVVNTVITLLPILANFSPQQFNELLLKDAVAWLLTILEKKGDISKPEAFLALGQIAKVSPPSLVVERRAVPCVLTLVPLPGVRQATDEALRGGGHGTRRRVIGPQEAEFQPGSAVSGPAGRGHGL
jgi:hypothetical protein